MTPLANHLKKLAAISGVLMVAAVMIAALPADALAAGESADWRPTFDLVMRWVNFLILAFVIVKFSKAPIKNFLENRKQEISSGIEALEAEKKKIEQEIDENRQKLENSRERLTQLKQRILADGEKTKQKIISDAENESRLMIESAGQKMTSRIEEARNELRSELVDLAVSIALKKLPAEINEQDNQKFIDTFLSETTEK